MENRVTVYTKFGYASVDLDKYKEAETDSASAGLQVQSPEIKDHQQQPPAQLIMQQQHDSANSTISTGSSAGTQLMSLATQDKIIEVNYQWGKGFIPRKEIRSKIKINVKTFHGKRVNYEFTVQITDKIEKLKDLLFQREPDEMTSYHVIKFVYPMGTLRNLSLEQTFEQLELPNGAQLVLLGQKTFTWDLNYKGSNIQLLNNCLTANKKYEIDWETVLGTVGFSSGSGGHSRHYWEIKLDTFVDMEDIFIGIARRGIDLHQKAWETGSFWGWICTGNRKFAPAQPGPQVAEYGGFSKINDTIGLLLEFKDGLGQISFYRNGKSLGTAFEGIPPGTYYPAVCMYYGEVQVTLNSQAKIPSIEGAAQTQ